MGDHPWLTMETSGTEYIVAQATQLWSLPTPLGYAIG